MGALSSAAALAKMRQSSFILVFNLSQEIDFQSPFSVCSFNSGIKGFF